MNWSDLTSKRSRFISELGQKLGVTGPVRAGLLFHATQGLCTALTLVCVVVLFTPVEQGYYFTFLSLLAAQQLLELGFSFVIMQVASHESVGLQWNGRAPEFLKTGEAERLARLLVWSLRWYGGVAAVFLFTVIPAGWLVLSGGGNVEIGDSWKAPWLAVGIVFAVNFAAVPLLSFLDGCGKISEVFAFRSWQEGVASLGLWLSLLGGLGLYSLTVYFAVRVIASVIYLDRYRPFFAWLWDRRTLPADDFNWFRECWPFQWRISASWGAGYFTFHMTTPIAFALLGPVAAGQWALTYQVVYGITQLFLVWVSAQAPALGKLAAQGKYRKMEAVFFQGAGRSIAYSAIALAAGYFLLRVALDHQLPYTDRVIEPAAAAILIAWALVNHVVDTMAVYLRAHREEPYLLPSIAGGILIPPSVYFFGSHFGMAGIASSYLVIGCLIGLGWGGMIFWRKILACRSVVS